MGVSMTCFWLTGALWLWVTHIASHFYTIHIWWKLPVNKYFLASITFFPSKYLKGRPGLPVRLWVSGLLPLFLSHQRRQREEDFILAFRAQGKMRPKSQLEEKLQASGISPIQITMKLRTMLSMWEGNFQHSIICCYLQSAENVVHIFMFSNNSFLFAPFHLLCVYNFFSREIAVPHHIFQIKCVGTLDSVWQAWPTRKSKLSPSFAPLLAVASSFIPSPQWEAWQ